MYINLRSRLSVLFTVLIVLGTGLFRIPSYYYAHGLKFQLFYTLIYIAACFQWFHSIRRHFLQREMRIILSSAALLMIFLLAIQFTKYELVPKTSILSRYLWYMYYTPFLLLPVLILHATLYVGKTDASGISPWWRLLYVPVVLLALGIFTNELHHLAFRFPPDALGEPANYTRGPLYFAAVAAIFLGILGILLVLFQRTANRRLFRGLWLPLLVMGIGLVYLMEYRVAVKDQKILQIMFALPPFCCLFFISYFQSLVLTHLIPTNRNHAEFLRSSTLQAGLADLQHQVTVRAAGGTMPDPGQLQAAEDGDVSLGGDELLKSRPVRGGHFYWIEDVRELNRLDRELEETRDYLEEEHAMLDAANRLEESRRRAQAQNRLYDRIATNLQPQLGQLSAQLENLPEEEEAFREAMRYAAIQGAYLKRRSNLLFLADSEKQLDSAELGLSIGESLDYVRLSGIECHAQIVPGCRMDAELVIFLYSLFQAGLEAALPTTNAVLVVLRRTERALFFYLEFGLPARPLPEQWLRDASAWGEVQSEWSRDGAFLSLTLPLGGDRP